MILDIFESLMYNAGLLLALSIAYDIIIAHDFSSKKMVEVYTGIAIGAIGLAIMIHPWVMQPGIVFDARTILFSMAAVFFGAIPAIIGGLMAIAFRIWMGGVGVLVGSSTIISAILWGLLWRYWHQRKRSPYSLMGFYQLGLLNHISMVFLMFLLPSDLELQVVQAIAIPVLVIYPLVTVLMGHILMRRRQRQKRKQALEKSEHEYRLLAENTKDMIILHDRQGIINYANKTARDFFGVESLEENKVELMQFVLPKYLPMLQNFSKESKEGFTGDRTYEMQVWNAQKEVRTVEVNSTKLSTEKQDVQLLAAVRDITDRISIEEQKDRYATRLEILRELDRIVLEDLPFEQACNFAMKKLQTLIPFKIMMVSSFRGQTIRFLALLKPELRHRYLNTKDNFPYSEKFSAQLLRERNFVTSDASTLVEEKNMPIRAALVKEGMQSFMSNAVIVQNELVGFLWFCSDEKNAFGPKHIEEGMECANQLAIVLHHMELVRQIKDHTRNTEPQGN